MGLPNPPILAQFPIGIEIIIILVVVAIVLLLGPRKIPELARGIGKALGEFRRGRQEIEREIQREMNSQPARGSTEQVYEINPRIIQAAQRLDVDTTGRKERELKLEILGSMREASRTRLEAVAGSLDVKADGLDDAQLRDEIAKALGI